MNRIRVSLFLIVLACLGALATSRLRAPEESGKERLFRQVMQAVQREAPNAAAGDSIWEAATRAAVGALRDPYAELMAPARHTEMMSQTAGHYGGIGLSIAGDSVLHPVVDVVPGSPAEEAGIEVGDELRSVDGTDVTRAGTEQIAELLRGSDGSTVRLDYTSGKARKSTVLTRREIRVPSVPVAFLAEDSIGYLVIDEFTEQTAEDLREASTKLVTAGARGLVIDLRDNPGGLFDESVDAASLFLPMGSRIVEARSHDQREVSVSHVRPLFPSIRIVVLVNAHSASAAEIFAGALQANHRATIAGDTTFGKGSVQSIVNVAGDYALKLTTARWFTPSGQSIARTPTHRGGIIPDVQIKGAQDERLYPHEAGSTAEMIHDEIRQYAFLLAFGRDLPKGALRNAALDIVVKGEMNSLTLSVDSVALSLRRATKQVRLGKTRAREQMLKEDPVVTAAMRLAHP